MGLFLLRGSFLVLAGFTPGRGRALPRVLLVRCTSSCVLPYPTGDDCPRTPTHRARRIKAASFIRASRTPALNRLRPPRIHAARPRPIHADSPGPDGGFRLLTNRFVRAAPSRSGCPRFSLRCKPGDPPPTPAYLRPLETVSGAACQARRRHHGCGIAWRWVPIPPAPRRVLPKQLVLGGLAKAFRGIPVSKRFPHPKITPVN